MVQLGGWHMINAAPLVLMTVWLLVLVAWFIHGHRLLYAFRDRYPQEADRKMEYAFDFRAHPSKFLYFLSKDCAAFLAEKHDHALLQMRRTVIRLSVAGLVVLFGGFAGIVVLALLNA